MLIKGRWLLCDDNVVRPVIETEVMAADGSWIASEFLVDTGADRTVFMASALTSLGLPHLPTTQQLGGVGGGAATVAIGTHLRFAVDGGGTIVFQGTFSAFTQADALDMNVLGRDIMNLFAVMSCGPVFLAVGSEGQCCECNPSRKWLSGMD